MKTFNGSQSAGKTVKMEKEQGQSEVLGGSSKSITGTLPVNICIFSSLAFFSQCVSRMKHSYHVIFLHDSYMHGIFLSNHILGHLPLV